MKSLLVCCLMSGALAAPVIGKAKDLGRLGPTFEIGEVDMLIWIKQRLTQLDHSGQLERLEQALAERVKQSVASPTALPLPVTETPTSFLVDPSLTLATNITDAHHQIIAHAGTQINPFDARTWPTHSQLPYEFQYSHVLVFLDARDERQLAFAQSFISHKPVKWILTGGRPNEASEVLGQRLYFDQQGRLSTKLHLKAVPSVVEQSGHFWKVTEIDVTSQASAP